MSGCREEDARRHGGGDGGGHGHTHGHGHGGHGHSHEIDDPSGNTLYPYIDRDRIMGLNEASSGMASRIVKSWDNRLEPEPHLETDEDDAELIITIPFIAAVHVRSFCIVSYEQNLGPNKVKIFKNRDDIDFDLARDLEATQEYDLIEDFNAAVDYPLSPSKFKGVTSLTLFFASNFMGDDVSTKMSYLGFKGEGTQERRGVVRTTYEASAQLKDHKKVEGTETAKNYLS